MKSLAGILFLVASSLCPAQLPAPMRPTTTYHSDAMGLDFVYPSSFSGPRDKAGAKDSETGCTSFPVMVMDMRKSFNMIFLKRIDLLCLQEKVEGGLGATAASLLSFLFGQFGRPVMGSSTDYDLAGHSASTVSGSVDAVNATGPHIIYGAASCVVAGKNTACFMFLSNECPSVAVLAASTVKFADGVPTPIIPSVFANTCKP